MIFPDKFDRLAPRRGQSDKEDIKEFTDRFGDENDLDEEAYERIANGVTKATQVVDLVMKYFWAEGDEPRVPLESLTLAEKCDLLQEIVLSRKSEEHCCARLMGDLKLLQHYDAERSAVLKEEWRNPGSVTYTEIAEVADSLITYSFILEESMVCEHDDFRSDVFAGPDPE
jgi:hypothetical protein